MISKGTWGDIKEVELPLPPTLTIITVTTQLFYFKQVRLIDYLFSIMKIKEMNSFHYFPYQNVG